MAANLPIGFRKLEHDAHFCANITLDVLMCTFGETKEIIVPDNIVPGVFWDFESHKFLLISAGTKVLYNFLFIFSAIQWFISARGSCSCKRHASL